MNYLLEHEFDEGLKRWNVVLSGEVDIFNSTELKAALLQLIEQKPVDICLDCKDLEYMDSTALGALVAVLKHVKVYDGHVYLRHVRSNLAKLFRITNLDKVFIIEGE